MEYIIINYKGEKGNNKNVKTENKELIQAIKNQLKQETFSEMEELELPFHSKKLGIILKTV